jgi:hypothetical protein
VCCKHLLNVNGLPTNDVPCSRVLLAYSHGAQAVLRFVGWAFKSRGQRAAEAQAAAYVQAQLAASQRMAQVRVMEA